MISLIYCALSAILVFKTVKMRMPWVRAKTRQKSLLKRDCMQSPAKTLQNFSCFSEKYEQGFLFLFYVFANTKTINYSP